jgi:hypothetical protein
LGGVEAVVDPAAGLAALDEVGGFEGFEVEGEFGLVDVEGGAQVADAAFTIAEEVEDLEADGVGEGLESVE